MRSYKCKTNSGDVTKLSDSDTTQTVRHRYRFEFIDVDILWAKEIEKGILYSADDAHYSEREDATHVVYLLK